MSRSVQISTRAAEMLDELKKARREAGELVWTNGAIISEQIMQLYKKEIEVRAKKSIKS